MKKCSFILILFFIVGSCAKKEKTIEKLKKVNFNSERKFESADIIKSIRLIKLQGLSPDAEFSDISKIKIRNGICYIMDIRAKSIFKFGLDGQFINKLEEAGKGPGEYLIPSDFDVDENANIYVFDGPSSKILKYSADGSYLWSHKLDFQIKALSVLKNGKFLLGLANYNTGKFENRKLIVCNSEFTEFEPYFEYDENVDKKYTLDCYFQESEKCILYNNPIDNTVATFSKQGNNIENFQFDFGKSDVPLEQRRDIGKVIEKPNHYCFLAMTPLHIGHYLVGTLYKENNPATFIYDLKTEKVDLNKYDPQKFSTTKLNLPFCAISDSIIVSYINYNIHPYFEKDNNLNDEMKSFLKAGNTVLCLYEIN